MQTVIFGSEYQSTSQDAITSLLSTLDSHGVHTTIERKFYDYICSTMNIAPRVAGIVDTDTDTVTADVAISLGGDGTFLRTMRHVALSGIPILGINTGSLGYLADITPCNIGQAIQKMVSGELSEELRTLVAVTTDSDIDIGFNLALNEVAILKAETASMVSICTNVNGEYLTTYLSDGLIVSSPTGSTAYNLSVGGPILSPSLRAFAISPVAAHSLNMRPIVINDDTTVSATVTSRSRNFRLSIDGRGVILPSGTTVTMSKAPVAVRILKLPDHNFASTLRNKLMWGIDPR